MGRATQFRVKSVGYGPAWVATLGLALAIGAWGCQKSQPDKGAKEKPVPEMVKGNLPQLGDYLPPLDHGRLEIAPPKDWDISPRSAQYLVRFQSDPNNPYPTILVTASDCDRFKNVTPENIEDFAKFVAAELETAGARTAVKMGKIGNLIGVIYTKRAKIKGSFGNIIDRRFFDTVVNGRRYRFELQAAPETIGLAEPYFFASVAGTKVVGVSEEEGLAAAGTAQAGESRKKAEGEKKTAATSAEGTPKAEQAASSREAPKPPASEAAQKAPETAAATKPGASPKAKEGAAAAQTKPAAKEAAAAAATKPKAAEPQEKKPTEQKPAEAKASQQQPAEPQPAEQKPAEKPAEKPQEEKPQQQGGTDDILKDVDALLK